ncbi:MAG: hypothetical protein KAH38_11870, partial [Candidatus Hydrogenedentes bacterium]|nr:hypothetical protein [Candidatus Hydrogenedentota bacterium]
ERQGDNVYIEAEFKINRKQWNIGYDSFKDALILEDVVVSLKMLAEEQDLDDWLRTTIIKPSQQQII